MLIAVFFWKHIYFDNLNPAFLHFFGSFAVEYFYQKYLPIELLNYNIILIGFCQLYHYYTWASPVFGFGGMPQKSSDMSALIYCSFSSDIDSPTTISLVTPMPSITNILQA